MVPQQRTRCNPRGGQNQRTNNETLKTWIPKIERIDDLLDANVDAKQKVYDQLHAIRVAYQTPATIRLKNNAPAEALSNTFEDALVFNNIELFSTLPGAGAVKKFRDAIFNSQDTAVLGNAMFDVLKTAKKAEFALDVIDSNDFDKIKTPIYIAEGLA